MVSVLHSNIVEKIRDAGHILLMTDERLDGDTLGSTLGLFHVLIEMGKRVSVFSPKIVPAIFHFLPNIDVIQTDVDVFLDNTIDLSIICDCSDGIYVTKLVPTMPRRVPLVMFDHHATNPHYGDYNVLEPNAASTADVVWRFVRNAGFPVTKNAAQCFLTGICTDTSIFSTSNTTAAAFDAAMELVRLGAKLPEIIKNTIDNISVPMLRVWGLLFSRLHHNPTFNALTTAFTLADWEAFGKPDMDTSSISNFLNASLDHADTIVILRESEDGGVKGSLRSRVRDVAALAETFGGGGHKRAAGFKIANAYLHEIDGIWMIAKNSITEVIANNDTPAVNFLLPSTLSTDSA